MKKELLIIIPAYNEGQNIRRVLTQVEGLNLSSVADILVINDASTDSTNWIVKEMQYPMISQAFNMGYGCALQTGYKYAVRRGYKYVIQMDGDGQHDVCNIPQIYQRLRETENAPDIVLASRFMEGSTEFPVIFLKWAAFRWFRFLIRLIAGRRIADPTTGLQGLSRRAFAYYGEKGHFDDKYPDANMVIQMLLLGFRVTEIPAVMHARKEGQGMHKGLQTGWYMCRMLFEIPAVIWRVRLEKRRGPAR